MDDSTSNEGELAGVKRVDVIASQRKVDSMAAREMFVDAFGHVAAAYGGGQGEYVLVRPDGYVGWVGLQTDLADLHHYLDLVSAK